MSRFKLEYLTGAIKIPLNCPENWERDGLDDFYRGPNDPKFKPWGNLARIVYHESIHFWQFLSSGYIANLVSEDWLRLLEFEKTGKILPLSENQSNYSKRQEKYPFSPNELVECWARYWDVHTRNALEIMKQENIEPNDSEVYSIDYGGQFPGYTDKAFDTVMVLGLDCQIYAAPYRWMLNEAMKVSGLEPSANSKLVCAVFPIIAHWAFTSSDPIRIFCESFHRAMDSNNVKMSLMQGPPNINAFWLSNWVAIYEECVKNLLVQKSKFSTGIEKIINGPLKNHPIFPEYNIKTKNLIDFVRKSVIPNPKTYPDKVEAYSLECASRDTHIMFALPGMPSYRFSLGKNMPPPRIYFNNLTYNSTTTTNEKTYERRSNALEKRVRRFRNAEYAVRKGKDPTIFEK